MATKTLETDYLVIGAGAAAMAFTDALITDSNADVIIVDRRHAPGGHWNEAYPFVRLHQPSAYYGVNSLPLGSDAIDRFGPNAGFYEQASAAEICAYYDRVMQTRFLPTGRVRYFPLCEYRGAHRFVSTPSQQSFAVKVRKKLVDTSYLETSVPHSTPPPFEVASDARCAPVNELARSTEHAGYVIIGAGKTAMDACGWLLQNGVAQDRIRWIKPRDAWLQNRAFAQGGEHLGMLFEGLVRQLEAVLEASSIEDLFTRLEARAQFLRVDERVTPTMYRGPTLSTREVEELRRIENVVRFGKVRRLERDAIVLERGTIPTSPDQLHVHCATIGLNPAPERPVFAPDRITLQSIRIGLLPFASAMIGYIEATRADLAEKNRLCPPTRQPNVPGDWVRGTINALTADFSWSQQPDIAAWLDRARLNATRGLRARVGEPEIKAKMARFVAAIRPALAKLRTLDG